MNEANSGYDSSPTHTVAVDGGAVPVFAQGPSDANQVPGLIVVPSIFGPARDLLERMAGLADASLVVVADPFWRVGGGVVAYEDHNAAFARLAGFDMADCHADMRAVIEWTRARCNGRVAGLGICFGGPVVLIAASEGDLSGVVAWHGTRMEGVLERVKEITCPLHFHFGGADPVTPPEVIEQIRDAFADHRDVHCTIHPGLKHGYSHEGESYDEAAAQNGVDDTRALLASLVSAA
ncbi:MAG: dienelactone hydrolase family protein [Myxococcales bacterium]|nr:dienelactone hydrolase family protein [Myxococcales bacterium]